MYNKATLPKNNSLEVETLEELGLSPEQIISVEDLIERMSKNPYLMPKHAMVTKIHLEQSMRKILKELFQENPDLTLKDATFAIFNKIGTNADDFKITFLLENTQKIYNEVAETFQKHQLVA
jgi:hypothetical protein